MTKRFLFAALLALPPVAAFPQGVVVPVGVSVVNWPPSWSATAAAGSHADGWNVTLGTTADAPWSGAGSATEMALLKAIFSAVTAPVPAGSSKIGAVGIDQSVPGQTNAVQSVDNTYVSGTCSANCLGTSLLGPIDTTGSATIDTQITVVGGGATINWQVSDDPVCSTASNWFNGVQASPILNDKASTNTTNLNFVGMVQTPVVGHCMRLFFNGYASGTYSAQASLRPFASVMQIGSPVAAALTGTPNGATQVTSSATGTTGALSATMAAASGYNNYLCGFTVTSAGTTSPAPVTTTITGPISGSLSYVFYPATTGAILAKEFSPCVQSSAKTTAIQMSVPALGSGSIAAVNLHGFWGP